jgi:hypothetical protein
MRRGRGGAVYQRSNEVGSQGRVGQVAGAQPRTATGARVDLAPATAAGEHDGYWSRFGRRFGWVLLVVGCLLLFVVVAMAVPVEGPLWLPILALEAFVLVALPVGLIVAAFPGRAGGSPK